MDYQILTPLVPFFLGIVLKIFLDFNLASIVVRKLYWLPVRNIFRAKPEKISGEWQQIWENKNSKKYIGKEGRKSRLKIKQFACYIYGEFRSNNDEEYYLFGEIIGRNIIGKWSDKNNSLGYYGAFELRIINSERIEGIWLGHSNIKPNIINHDNWIWTKNL